MASVSTPDIQDVLRATGLAEYASLDTDAEQLLASTIEEAVAYTALAIGESTYSSSSLTAKQALLIKRAVTLRAGAMALVNPRIRTALGTPEPLLGEDAAAIGEAAMELRREAESIETLISTGTDTQKPFALPASAVSSFTVTSSERSPSELNALRDETDDVSAWDTENG